MCKEYAILGVMYQRLTQPEIETPVLLVAFDGWIDAGAAGYVRKTLGAKSVASALRFMAACGITSSTVPQVSGQPKMTS